MKILESLLAIFSKMEKKETKEFERYLAYKNRNRLIKLYECFLQKEDVESISYSLKRKKLERDLRKNLKELLKLTKKFLVDREDTVNNMELNIFNIISFATHLEEKGMFKAALEQLELAEQLSNENSLYPQGYHASRKHAVLSWRQYPGDSEMFFEELRVKHDNYLDSMKEEMKQDI